MIACYTPFPATTVESQSQCFFTYYMLRLNYLKTSMQNSLESGMPIPSHKKIQLLGTRLTLLVMLPAVVWLLLICTQHAIGHKFTYITRRQRALLEKRRKFML